MSRPESQSSATPMSGQTAVALEDPMPEALENDPRWVLAQRIAGGPHFARSPLMSKFLLYVVTETIEGRQNGITEHQIGVRVFGRPAVYRTDEDNIVRNYARQLRKRLAEHFAGEGSYESMRLDIPVGGYVPAFTAADHTATDRTAAEQGVAISGIGAEFAIGFGEATGATSDGAPNGDPRARSLSDSAWSDSTAESSIRMRWGREIRWLRWLSHIRSAGRGSVALILAYSALLVGLTWLIATGTRPVRPSLEPSHLLWKSLLSGSRNTYIVPPDAGLNIVEDISHRTLALPDYIKGSYLEVPLAELDDHARQDLRTQQFSDFLSMQIVASIAKREEYDPQRVFLRFPRDLRLDDLKTSNVVLLGSLSSNPWAAIADRSTNFRIVPKEGMAGAVVVNSRPMPGEAASYESHWNEPSHDTYALIVFAPNLSGKGYLLLLEGLDVAGTQAAAEVLFHPETIDPILNRAKAADGSLRSFEVLLRTTSIQSNSAGTQVVAVRIH